LSLAQPDPKETTEKYGLEAGLWQVLSNKDPVTGKTKGQQAKDLLKRYGGAYLITSISFAIVSFAACYALVTAGGLQLLPLDTRHLEALSKSILYLKQLEQQGTGAYLQL
jgi:hypothetical protein